MKISRDSEPSVAVAMTVRNAVNYVEEAIDSILEQSYGDFEFSVVDDGSDDGTSELLDNYAQKDSRIKVIHQTNLGFQVSINNAILASTAPLIARMDADDVSHPQRLEKQVAFLRDHPDYVLVGTNAMVVDKDGVSLYETQLPEDDVAIRDALKVGLPFYHGSLMFYRQAAEQVGYYDIVPKIEDVLICRKLSAFGKMSNLRAPLYTFRLVPSGSNNMTPTVSKKRHDILFRLGQGHPLRNSDIEFLGSSTSTLTYRQRVGQYYLRVGKGILHYRGDRWAARKALVKAAWYSPSSPHVWFNLGLSFLPMPWIRAWERKRNAMWQAGT